MAKAKAAAASSTSSSAARRFVDSYYVFNSLLVLAYLPMRLYFRLVTPDGSDYGSVHSLHEFATWEKEALTSYAVLVVWQFVRRRSWDHYAQSVFFYGKIITAATLWLVDKRLMTWYVLLCWVAIAVCPQPMVLLFDQTEADVIAGLSPVRMKELVMQGAGGDTPWLLYLYAEQHSPSIAMAPAFLELAQERSSSKLRFGAMDVTLWPSYSKDTLRVPASTWTAHLPAVVLYSKGKEVGRLPRPEDIDDIGLKKNHYTKKDVVKKLQLDRFR